MSAIRRAANGSAWLSVLWAESSPGVKFGSHHLPSRRCRGRNLCPRSQLDANLAQERVQQGVVQFF